MSQAFLTTFTILALSVFAASHALLNKRQSNAALLWVCICLFIPVLGPIVYLVFGHNRYLAASEPEDLIETLIPPKDPGLRHYKIDSTYEQLVNVGDAVTTHSLLNGNSIEPLYNGSEAFPEMLKAINEAQERVVLSTYIFETNKVGRLFIDALAAAKNRGVQVLVLLDGIGNLYSWPHASTALARLGVSVERFLPPSLLPPSLSINLRNHRKILVADGCIGFTGGMNIGDRYLNDGQPDTSTDIHFKLLGPIVGQLEQVFCRDWYYTTGEQLFLPSKTTVYSGSMICRTVVDGPDDDLFKLPQVIQAAVSSARHSLMIMTPYFLPTQEITAAIQTAALRGVDVTIVIPSKNNLPYVHWAMQHILPHYLEYGVKIFFQPPPFAHGKLLLVDSVYSLIGTANIDARSLRLNFEVAVEVFSAELNKKLAKHFHEICLVSQAASLFDTKTRPLLTKLRNGLAWLASPYL